MSFEIGGVAPMTGYMAAVVKSRGQSGEERGQRQGGRRAGGVQPWVHGGGAGAGREEGRM